MASKARTTRSQQLPRGELPGYTKQLARRVEIAKKGMLSPSYNMVLNTSHYEYVSRPFFTASGNYIMLAFTNTVQVVEG